MPAFFRFSFHQILTPPPSKKKQKKTHIQNRQESSQISWRHKKKRSPCIVPPASFYVFFSWCYCGFTFAGGKRLCISTMFALLLLLEMNISIDFFLNEVACLWFELYSSNVALEVVETMGPSQSGLKSVKCLIRLFCIWEGGDVISPGFVVGLLSTNFCC